MHRPREHANLDANVAPTVALEVEGEVIVVATIEVLLIAPAIDEGCKAVAAKEVDEVDIDRHVLRLLIENAETHVVFAQHMIFDA